MQIHFKTLTKNGSEQRSIPCRIVVRLFSISAKLRKLPFPGLLLHIDIVCVTNGEIMRSSARCSDSKDEAKRRNEEKTKIRHVEIFTQAIGLSYLNDGYDTFHINLHFHRYLCFAFHLIYFTLHWPMSMKPRFSLR